MGIFSSRIDYKFLNQCEKQLSQLDNSLSSLASSVDSVHGTIKLLINQLEDVVSTNTDTEENMVPINFIKTLTLTTDLLGSVEHSLYHDKMALIQGTSQFVHLMKDKTENKNLILRHMPTLQSLTIDKYIADFQKKQKLPSTAFVKQKTNLSNSSAEGTEDLAKSMEDAENRNKELEKESSSIKLANSFLRAEIDELQIKYETSRKEIEENAARINALMEENEQLRKDLKKALRKTEPLPVQIFHQRRGELMALIEEELFNRLNENLASNNRELDLIKCESSSNIQPDIPLLVLCISTSRVGTDAVNAIQGVVEMENTALLIFHHKDEHALPTQTSDRVLAGPKFKALRGIYDLAFLSGKGMYVCEMNTHAIANITDFLCKVTEETCATRNVIREARSSKTMLSR